MTKKILLAAVAATAFASNSLAGGLMTNTNYHIAFDRMMARGASMDIDAAYSNPAGLAWGHDGLQFSLDFQKPWQNRDIEYGGKTYEGKASAPIVPALFGSYKQDKWAVSAMIGIVGSGGYVEYNDGIPMFNVPISAMLASRGLTSDMYTLDSEMKGKQYIYGGQLNFTYRLTDFLSAAVGVRANYYDGYYRGHVVADRGGMKLVNLQLDCDQRAWGFAPVVGVDFHKGPMTIAAKYEFRTKINTKNSTNELTVGMMQTAPVPAYTETDVKAMAQTIGNDATVAALSQTALGDMAGKIRNYLPEERTRYDMPSLLAVAMGYEITPRLRATVEYHYFDDTHAKMADNRQKALTKGTNEFQLGAEYDINDQITVSLGGQRTDYGLSDDYQMDTSFACDSYSVGLGAAVRLTDMIRLNAGYFITLYSDYTKESALGQETYSRTNNVIGLGIDFKF